MLKIENKNPGFSDCAKFDCLFWIHPAMLSQLIRLLDFLSLLYELKCLGLITETGANFGCNSGITSMETVLRLMVGQTEMDDHCVP